MRDVPNFLRELADLIERHADVVPPSVIDPAIIKAGDELAANMLKSMNDDINRQIIEDLKKAGLIRSDVEELPVPQSVPPLPSPVWMGDGFQHRVPQQPLWDGEVFKSNTRNVYDDGHKTVCNLNDCTSKS